MRMNNKGILSKVSDKNHIKLCILIIIIGAVLRIGFAAYHEVSGDACWHLSAARFISTQKGLPLFEGLGRLEPFWPPPAFHLISAFFYFIFRVFGESATELGLKIVSPLMGTLTVLVSFLLLKRSLMGKPLVYSMLFLNFIPIFMDYSTFSYVDSTAAFFSVLSIYFIFINRYFLASTSFGIAFLSKYNVIFLIPLIAFLIYKTSKKNNIKANFGFLFISILLSSLWLVRNWIYFHNPVWPFMNGIFHGLNIGVAFNSIDFSNILSLNPYIAFYLELFGVPNGNMASISYLPQVLKPFIVIWFISSAIFIFPFILGLLKNKSKGIIYSSSPFAFLPFMLMLFIYLITTRWFSPRLLMPIMFFIALYWAEGLISIKNKMFKKAYLTIIVLICLGFVAGFALKLYVAKEAWKDYHQDFDWVNNNLGKTAILYGNGQCVPYKAKRLMLYSTVEDGLQNADYVWINGKWNIDFKPEKEFVLKIESANNLEQVYENKDSGTKIYKIKK